LAGCHLVVGTSARHERTLAWEVLEPRECSQKITKQAKTGGVAILFGRENSGLTNDELSLCHYLVHIPTNPDYSSLNLASAVQILSYECRVASQMDDEQVTEDQTEEEVVTADMMEGYYKHLEAAMIDSKFLDPENPKHLMTRLRRLYGRVRVTPSELNILRGMLVAFQKKK